MRHIDSPEEPVPFHRNKQVAESQSKDGEFLRMGNIYYPRKQRHVRGHREGHISGTNQESSKGAT